MDGIGGVLAASRRLYFPLPAVPGAKTLFLYNPDARQVSTVSLRLLSQRGSAVAEAEYHLPVLGSLQVSLQSLVEEPAAMEEAGYLQLDSALPIRGFVVSVNESSIVTVAGQASRRTDRIVAPHFFFSEPEGNTHVQLINTGLGSATVEIVAYDDEADRVGSASIEMGPGELFAGDLDELLGRNRPRELTVTGYLEVRGEARGLSALYGQRPSLLGQVVFSGLGGRAVACLPMIVEGRRETALLHVAESPELEIFMGLSILNMSDESAAVSLEVFDQNGQETAHRTISLAARKRVIDLLSGPALLGEGFSQLGGHMRIRSGVPLAVFALVGDEAGEFLAAVEGQVLLCQGQPCF
jgi:hypothetical protein